MHSTEFALHRAYISAIFTIFSWNDPKGFLFLLSKIEDGSFELLPSRCEVKNEGNKVFHDQREGHTCNRCHGCKTAFDEWSHI